MLQNPFNVSDRILKKILKINIKKNHLILKNHPVLKKNNLIELSSGDYACCD